jgi:hypothetical protein
MNSVNKDGLKGFLKTAPKMAFKTAFTSSNSNESTSTKNDSTTKNSPLVQEEKSFLPTVIKMLVGIFIGLIITWFYFNNFKGGNPKSNDSKSNQSNNNELEPTSYATPEKEVIQNEPKPIRFEVDDPSKPPYGMFVAAYQGKKQLFRFDMPDNVSFTLNDSSIVFETTGVEKTTLVSENFMLSYKQGKCIQPEDVLTWEKTTINGKDFYEGSSGSSATGHNYSKSYYVFESVGYCFTLLLDLETVNGKFYDTPLKEFNSQKEYEKMESIKKTLKFNE